MNRKIARALFEHTYNKMPKFICSCGDLGESAQYYRKEQEVLAKILEQLDRNLSILNKE